MTEGQDKMGQVKLRVKEIEAEEGKARQRKLFKEGEPMDGKSV